MCYLIDFQSNIALLSSTKVMLKVYAMGKFYAGLNKVFLFEKPINQKGYYFKGPVLLKQSL